MTAIPIPWVLSIFACILVVAVLVRMHQSRGASFFFSLSLLSTAVVSALVGSRLEYGFAFAKVVQPHFGALIAPGIWLGFRSLMTQTGWPKSRETYMHGFVAVLVQVGVALPVNWSTEIVLIMTNGTYLVLLASRVRMEGDAFVQIPVDGYFRVKLCLVGAVFFLGLVLYADIAILLADLVGGEAMATQFLTGATNVLVAASIVTALIAAPVFMAGRERQNHNTTKLPPPSEKDHAILNQAKGIIFEHKLYADPNLSLARLARRLGLPAKALSQAINRCTGANFSRFINGFRIHHSKDMLRSSSLPISEIMLSSGFVSKSAFNTEFRRLTDKTPTEYRKVCH